MRMENICRIRDRVFIFPQGEIPADLEPARADVAPGLEVDYRRALGLPMPSQDV